MVLGDSFSRNPEHRDALLAALEARSGDLKAMHTVLKGFDVQELRTTEPWNGEFRPPSHKEITANWPGVKKDKKCAETPESITFIRSHLLGISTQADGDMDRALLLLVLPPTPLTRETEKAKQLEALVAENFDTLG